MLSRLMEVGGRALRVRRLGGTRAGEIRLTRFLRNDAVTIDEMIEQAGCATSQRCQGRHVLAIQDTTVIRSAGGGGDYLHAVVALDAQDGTLLGLINGQFLSRTSGRKALRHGTAVEAKESFRWLQGADQAASTCAGAARITVVTDRESDLDEAFALRPQGVDLLIRAAQDRSLEEGGRLFAKLDGLAPAGHASIDLPAAPGRGKRTTRLALRFAAVSLAQPQRGAVADLATAVTVNAVDICEVDPPSGAPAVHCGC